MDKIIKQFNTPDTLLVLTSFPQMRGEVAVDNAIARYSKLLVENFPKEQKVVIICEKRVSAKGPYKLAENILVVPAYWVNSPLFVAQVLRTMRVFSQAKNVLVQFEFSIYGGKGSIPGILATLALVRLMGKNVSIMLHQVVKDINSLAGHLGLSKYGFAAGAFNILLTLFYWSLGVICQKVLVHDSSLKALLVGLIPEANIYVIPHGTGESKLLSDTLRKKARAGLGLTQKDKVVLAFGYKSWYKGTDWIVEQVGTLAQKYPNKNIKLLLAGSESPTLKNTNAYKLYSAKLSNLLKKHDGEIVQTGFVPEAKVEEIFAASDIVSFPYRTRMSASGALSLAWQYGKPVIVSKDFARNLKEADIAGILGYYDYKVQDITFNLSDASFEKILVNLMENAQLRKKVADSGFEIAGFRCWSSVAREYLRVTSLVPARVSAEDVTYATTG